MSALETLTPNKGHPSLCCRLLGHLNATTFSQFLKTICFPGHRSITFRMPDSTIKNNVKKIRSFQRLNFSAHGDFCHMQNDDIYDIMIFFEIIRNLYIYIYYILYILYIYTDLHSDGETQQNFWRLRFGVHGLAVLLDKSAPRKGDAKSSRLAVEPPI